MNNQDNSAMADLEDNSSDLSECSSVCLNGLRHCLKVGGKYADPVHLKLLFDCADICQAASHAMFPKSGVGRRLIELCAQVCEHCAESCRQLDDDPYMELCAQACQDCAISCRDIAETEFVAGGVTLG